MYHSCFRFKQFSQATELSAAEESRLSLFDIMC